MCGLGGWMGQRWDHLEQGGTQSHGCKLPEMALNGLGMGKEVWRGPAASPSLLAAGAAAEVVSG